MIDALVFVLGFWLAFALFVIVMACAAVFLAVITETIGTYPTRSRRKSGVFKP